MRARPGWEQAGAKGNPPYPSLTPGSLGALERAASPLCSAPCLPRTALCGLSLSSYSSTWSTCKSIFLLWLPALRKIMAEPVPGEPPSFQAQTAEVVEAAAAAAAAADSKPARSQRTRKSTATSDDHRGSLSLSPLELGTAVRPVGLRSYGCGTQDWLALGWARRQHLHSLSTHTCTATQTQTGDTGPGTPAGERAAARGSSRRRSTSLPHR